MKTRFTFFVLLFAFILSSLTVFSQSVGDYQTFATGNWSAAATWSRWDGATWVNPAPSAPTSADGVITILNTHNVTLTGPVTADQITVATGGTLTINVLSSPTGGNDLILAGAGTQLTVDGTVLLDQFNFIRGTGSMIVNGTLIIGHTVTANAAGTVQVPTVISGSGIVNLIGNGQKTFDATFTNNGTFNWGTGNTAGGIQIGNTGTPVFTNNGTFNEQFLSNRGFITGSTGSFVNNGIFNKTTSFQLISNGVSMTNSATGIIQGINNFNISGTSNNAGTFEGTGTLVIAGTITNTGIVEPGNNAIGNLTVSPAFITGKSPNMRFEILDASGPGTGNDRLTVSNSTNLNGTTLTIVDISPSNAPAPLGFYTIMNASAGTFAGTPSTFNLPTNYVYTGIVGGNTVQVEKIALFPLPLVWGDFTALVKNSNQVQLKWSTLQEQNVSHFTLEHSTNGINYVAIGTVTAAGNTSDRRDYSFLHTAPDLQRNNYYRIRQTDIDAKSTYSVVRPVRFTKGNVVAVLATPNPVKDILQLSVQTEGIRIVLSDMSGKVFQSLDLKPGVHPINMERMHTGMYQLTIYERGVRIESQKIMKL